MSILSYNGRWAIALLIALLVHSNSTERPFSSGIIHPGARLRYRRPAPDFPEGCTLSKKQRPTPEQDEIRLRGLRILARMIVRAHLDGTAGEGQESGSGQDTTGPARDVPGKDGEHVR